jgi:hypothetical protein
MLQPVEVNDPDNCKLLRCICPPIERTRRTGSDFDTFLLDGCLYPSINHNLDQATGSPRTRG